MALGTLQTQPGARTRGVLSGGVPPGPPRPPMLRDTELEAAGVLLFLPDSRCFASASFLQGEPGAAGPPGRDGSPGKDVSAGAWLGLWEEGSRTGLHGAGGGVLPGGFPESVMAPRLPAARPRPAGTRGSHGRGGLAEPLVRPSVSAMRRAAQPGCTRAASPGCFSASAVHISRARPSHCPVPCGT